MKLTTNTLKKIIREEIELAKVRKIIREALNEAPPDEGAEAEAAEILAAVAKKHGVKVDDKDVDAFKQQNGPMMKSGQKDRVEKAAEQMVVKSKK